ncbi:hypothetical protein A1O7_02684 [Cladophialophora yegresii CBS 114405]|uniref:DUF7492 domain-containing protein n=1 Tax=Cladophialophora yegresii CBS 114405 TaxID=1182544 RepID=W9WCG6_9EURO|nr:uncharacterized protein A1O7_02684 [Cladophialophora yegresii CBS 114405]EXJ62251.1 hypothetical protein A1O7_02684 [Cladophialophora yegresii CBS 114405]
MPIKSILSSALIGLIASAPLALAHTWVEQLMVIAPNGTLVGEPGFPRGNVLRGTPGFGDPTMVNLIPPDGRTINQVLPSDLMCKSSQTSQTQTDGSPRLQAAPGDAVALRFQENGHVTLPDNQPGKPKNRGTVYVYGTTKASPDDSFLAIHRVWTPDGTGGDGRGRLLSTRNFDDGQCYQTNGGSLSQQRQQQFKHPFDMVMGNDLWCQQDIQLPTDMATGQPYTLYWVWDWPTMPGTPGFPNGKQEIYTTCMDIDIVGDSGIVPVSKAQVNFAQGQPYDLAAVPEQMSDLANPTAVTGQTIPFSNVPTSLLTRRIASPTTTTPLLTSSSPTGSTIAFSASATGPAAGAASEASIFAATASDTSVPGFLSVHTGSTAGPGLETQTFTVIPIGVSTADSSQPTGGADGNGRGGRGGDNNSASSHLPAFMKSLLEWFKKASANSRDSSGPQVTGAPNAVGNAQQVATFTEYESVTQTLLQTVYVTKYTKRDAGESSPTAPTVSSDGSPSPATLPFSRTHPWANMNFTRSGGRPPWLSGVSASGTGRPHFRPTGWPQGNRSSNGHGHGRNDHNQTTITVQSIVSLTTYMPSAAAATAPIAASPFPPLATTESVSPTSPFTYTATSTVIPVTSTLSLPTSAPVPPSSERQQAQSLTVLPIQDLAATLAPTPTSTNHAAFRLRARNPFVALGWMSAKGAETTTTAS